MNRQTIDKKISRIERNIAAQVIFPPQKVCDYMKGKEVEREEEGLEIRRLYNSWMEDVERTINSQTVTAEQVLCAIPEPFRTAVIEELKKLITEAKAT